MDVTQEIVDYLFKLANKEITPKHGKGIYHELRNEFNIRDCELFEYFKSWEHFSGFITCPVPHLRMSPGFYLIHGMPLWNNKHYDNLQCDLCRHIATEMQKELNR